MSLPDYHWEAPDLDDWQDPSPDELADDEDVAAALWLAEIEGTL